MMAYRAGPAAIMVLAAMVTIILAMVVIPPSMIPGPGVIPIGRRAVIAYHAGAETNDKYKQQHYFFYRIHE